MPGLEPDNNYLLELGSSEKSYLPKPESILRILLSTEAKLKFFSKLEPAWRDSGFSQLGLRSSYVSMEPMLSSVSTLMAVHYCIVIFYKLKCMISRSTEARKNEEGTMDEHEQLCLSKM